MLVAKQRAAMRKSVQKPSNEVNNRTIALTHPAVAAAAGKHKKKRLSLTCL